MSKKVPNKREQFTKSERSKLPLILTVCAVVIGAVLLFVSMGPNQQNQEGDVYFGEVVAASRSYIGEFISMTNVEATIEDGKIIVDFDEVDQNNIVYFEVENNENQMVPLMAYITPTGRVFAGSSMCEPCRGRKFSLAGETLVCDTCRTTYNIENHTFISGAPACGSYPPVNMNPQIEGDKIIIDLEEVLNWRIRA